MTERKRRFFERAIQNATRVTPNVVSEGTIVYGDIRGKGLFVVSGEINGDGDLDGPLHMAVSGVWNGIVKAQQALVAGHIIGGLIVEDKVEIGHTAVIRGRVSARTIAIAKGAIVDGQLETTSGAVIEFEEKRGDN
jgi:cytoskeletal protein CcmA (bactofilin family)